MAASASKLGGVIALGVVVAGIAPPDLGGSAVLTAVAMAVAAIAVAIFGIETRRQRLEEIDPNQRPVAVA